MHRWHVQGLNIGSQNMGGLTDFKLFLVLEMHDLDVVCLQETWLPKDAAIPAIPGYQLVEQRRQVGPRGGIAVYVRRGLKLLRHVGNEYVQWVQLQLPDSSILNVCNVYLPATANLAKRRVEEATARAHVEEVLAAVPPQQRHLVCGDFNTRLGELAPEVGEVQDSRVSVDSFVCRRAGWMIGLCERGDLHILNGLQPGLPAQHTSISPKGEAVVDYILSSEGSMQLKSCTLALQGLSDHACLLTHLPTSVPPLAESAPARSAPPGGPQVPPPPTYRWVEGTSVHDYAQSSVKWREHTSKGGFAQGLAAIVGDQALGNAARSQRVEAYLLEQAVEAGVVRLVEDKVPSNPNKLHKQLAPWFDESCREAKRKLVGARR